MVVIDWQLDLVVLKPPWAKFSWIYTSGLNRDGFTQSLELPYIPKHCIRNPLGYQGSIRLSTSSAQVEYIRNIIGGSHCCLSQLFS